MPVMAPPAVGPRPCTAIRAARGAENLRVLHLVPALQAGGMERALLRLLDGFARTENRDTDPPLVHAVCVMRQADPDLLAEGRSLATTWCLGQTGGRAARARHGRRLREVVESFRPGVVHARTTGVWLDAAIAARGRSRLLLSFHGRTSLARPGWLRRQILRWACRRANAVLTVSREAADFVRQTCGVPAERISVIPNGVDTARFRPADDGDRQDRARAALRGTANHVAICVASFVDIKAVDRLLTAWRTVVMAAPDACLWLVGDGPRCDRLVRLAGELRLAGRVRFLGPRRDVPELLRAADLFVLPSRYEASSNATLEAMASGLPVVAFDVGGMSEIVQHQHTGWLVPADQPDRLGRTLLAALLEPAARQRVGQAARRAVLDRYDLADWVDRYDRLYRDLMEGDFPSCAG